ncbi:MAG: hypothetical protein HUJ86_01930, partial [Synergistes sp.]|nr:hypothetical protein [Synergistes sp.]
MFVQEYDVELLSDVSITSDAATSGPHSSLDFLPGSVFLGAAVNASLKRGEKFDHDFFLSGHTRFMNALPMAGDELCRPIPLCFAYRKGSEWEGDSPVNFLNRKQESTKKEGKIKQWKEGYISENGTVFHTLMNDAVKTAIDRESRRAKDSQLFSTQSITAGTHFRTAMHADSEEDLNRADNLLFSEGGLLRIGRSRSAEYGAVKLTR